MKSTGWLLLGAIVLSTLTAAIGWQPVLQEPDPTPPKSPVKLIFIHHSTGENWLNDDNGGLARELQANNYFPSDTNYGWGPVGIGDRTDIPNWMEWFRSDNSPLVMQAVYEEYDVHSPFERTLPDPGGENQIILFKSCFPNSALEGNPTDPPSEGSDLSVGNAKYTYNQILHYFKTRPDKLFVVVTAPPLTDSILSNNARAFNLWLVNDWLRENKYTLPNVAVFDFYNVLTGPNNHHRVTDGKIEHIINDNRNTEYYPSDDDHPSQTGNQKATEEFLPLLNVFYNRWQASAPPQLAPEAGLENQPVTENQSPQLQNSQSYEPGSILFGFEFGEPEWEGYADEAVQSTILCGADPTNATSGSQSLRIEFNVLPNSWATCSRFFGTPLNLSVSNGLEFKILVKKPGKILHMDIYTGPDGERASYAVELEYPSEQGEWILVRVNWNDFRRVEWEPEAGSAFDQPDKISGLAFGFPAGEEPNTGVLNIDDIRTFTQGESVGELVVPGQVEEDELTNLGAENRRFPQLCGSIVIVPFALAIGMGIRKTRFRV